MNKSDENEILNNIEVQHLFFHGMITDAIKKAIALTEEKVIADINKRIDLKALNKNAIVRRKE